MVAPIGDIDVIWSIGKEKELRQTPPADLTVSVT